MYFTAKPLYEDSLVVADPQWNEGLKMMYDFVHQFVDEEDEITQKEVQKVVASSSNLCYDKYVANGEDVSRLYLPIPFKDNQRVMILKVDRPSEGRENMVLMDISQDLVLIKDVSK